MAGLEIKQLDSTPDEVRPFVARGRMELVNLANGPVGRTVFEPGWRWSEHVKPLAGTESCQATHLGYVLSGRLHVRMDDGSEGEAGVGEVVRIDPGHDAWVVGDEPCVMVDFGAVADGAARA
jgi:quercetin dioxygenase-like cupin family protein